MEWVIFWLLLLIPVGVLAHTRGRSAGWWVFTGLLLSAPFALILLVCLPRRDPKNQVADGPSMDILKPTAPRLSVPVQFFRIFVGLLAVVGLLAIVSLALNHYWANGVSEPVVAPVAAPVSVPEPEKAPALSPEKVAPPAPVVAPEPKKVAAPPVTLDAVVVPGAAGSAAQALSLSADDRAKIAASDEAHSRAYDARAAVMAYDKAHRPREFQIFGRITDRTSETSILIYGKALPISGNGSEFGAVFNDAAIFVLGAKSDNPVMFVGNACFIRREQDGATNGYGAKVPVWVFGPCTHKPDQHSHELEIKAQELEKIAKTKEAAAAPAQARLNAIKEREAAAEEAKAAAPAPEKPAVAVAASEKAVLVGLMSYQKQGRPTSVPVRWKRWFSSMELCSTTNNGEVQDLKDKFAKAGIPLKITPDASPATSVSLRWIDESGIEIERQSGCEAQ